MSSPHNLVPVGMMGIQVADTILQSNLSTIYQGDNNFTPEACNAVQSYQLSTSEGGYASPFAQYTTLVSKAKAASNGRLTCLVGDLTQKNAPHWFYDQNLSPDTAAVSSFVTNGRIPIVWLAWKEGDILPAEMLCSGALTLLR